MRRRIVPLFVALLVLGFFYRTRERASKPPGIEITSDVERCRQHLLSIYDGLRAYNERFGHLPERSGVGFFLSLVADGIWEDNEASASRLTCPGPSAALPPEGTSYSDPSGWTSASSAYAGRNVAAHPIEKFPAGGPAATALLACDNEEGWNHAGIINVLYTDRTVRSFELSSLLKNHVLAEGTKLLHVGPDSELEDLRVLTDD